MKPINNPIWLLLLNTLPSIILLILGFNIWYVINSQLNPDELFSWYMYSGVLFALTIFISLYSLVKIRKKEIVTPLASALVMVAYLALLSTYSVDNVQLVPWRIPRWMILEDVNMLIGSFLMPTMIYSMINIVVWAVNLDRSQRPIFSFLYMLAIPLGTYLFAQLVFPFWNPMRGKYSEHFFVVLLVVLSVLFLFFLLTWVYRLVIKKDNFNYELLSIKIIVSIIMPILGLLLNTGFVSSWSTDPHIGVFGDFTSIWFFVLVIINAAFFLLPDNDKVTYRLLRFLGRSIMYTYILYFAIVFLPYVPIALPMTILLGLGLLMLTPLFLIVFQSRDLFVDWCFLKRYYNPWMLSLVLMIGLITIPSIITVVYIGDKKVVAEALDYVYDSSYDTESEVDFESLIGIIRTLKNNRGSRATFLVNNNNIPILSTYYNFVVFDNLTLSRSKIEMLKAVFLDGRHKDNIRQKARSTNGVKLKSINKKSTYDPGNQEWTSWIDLEVENTSKTNFGEYITEFEMPVGAWISDYYLYVGEEKEYGILTDKKSANWIYNQIRNENRDPGILSYESEDKIRFKVFPVSEKEVRTGIQITHKGKVEINIDGKTIILGTQKGDSSHTEGIVTYISSTDKKELPTTIRSPYFHFIIDMSSSKKDSAYLDIIKFEKMIEDYPNLADGAKISFVNSYTKTTSFRKGYDFSDLTESYKGGFYLEKAINGILVDAYKNRGVKYPIIITDSVDFTKAIIGDGFSELEYTMPESKHFYTISDKGSIACHSLLETPQQIVGFVPFEREVTSKVWPNENGPVYYLDDDNQASMILHEDKGSINSLSPWESGLSLKGKWMSLNMNPEESKELWSEIIYESFKSRIMTPLTSFIIVENEAQKRVLLKKQKLILSGNKNLDLSGDIEEMSEPRLWVLLIFLLFIWLIKKRKLVINRSVNL